MHFETDFAFFDRIRRFFFFLVFFWNITELVIFTLYYHSGSLCYFLTFRGIQDSGSKISNILMSCDVRGAMTNKNISSCRAGHRLSIKHKYKYALLQRKSRGEVRSTSIRPSPHPPPAPSSFLVPREAMNLLVSPRAKKAGYTKIHVFVHKVGNTKVSPLGATN